MFYSSDCVKPCFAKLFFCIGLINAINILHCFSTQECKWLLGKKCGGGGGGGGTLGAKRSMSFIFSPTSFPGLFPSHGEEKGKALGTRLFSVIHVGNEPPEQRYAESVRSGNECLVLCLFMNWVDKIIGPP